MHLRRGVPALAAILSLAATAPSAAYGLERASYGASGVASTTVVQPHSSDSTDWLVAIGAAGGVTVVGGGMVVKRRQTRDRKRAHTATAS
jgi:hypothetical protein